MTKKKYRQQSDVIITPSSESASSSSFVPVSHSDDEGNVIIDTTTTDAPAYEPIPELVETETSYKDLDPIISDTLSALIETVAPVPVPDRILHPDPIPDIALALAEEALVPALVEEGAGATSTNEHEPTGLTVDVALVDVATALVKDGETSTLSNPIALVKDGATSTPEPRGLWTRFKSWFGRCCSCCCCCCHRRRHRESQNKPL
jgi:hypothetical protein